MQHYDVGDGEEVAGGERDLGLEGADGFGGAAASNDGVPPARELQREGAAQPPADPRDEHRPRPRRRRPRGRRPTDPALGPRRHPASIS